MWAQLANTMLGIWLMIAPAVLGYGDPARTNDRIVGPIAAALAFVAVSEATRGVRWACLPIGAWLVLTPWMLDYGATTAIHSVLSGLAMLVLATRGGRTSQRFGGGWSSLWSSGVGDRDDAERVGERS